MAEADGLLLCSSILPWRSCGTQDPWAGATPAEKTIVAVAAVEATTPTVLGRRLEPRPVGPGVGRLRRGPTVRLESVERLGLQVPTAFSPHQIEDLLSIDHIAVFKSWVVSATQRHRAFVGESRISDHDAYVVEAASADDPDAQQAFEP